MESCIRISLSEYIDPDQSQLFDHSRRNEIWQEPFPPARTCDRSPCNRRQPVTISTDVPATMPVQVRTGTY